MICVGVDGKRRQRFDPAPLLALVPGTAAAQAERLGVTTRTIHRWRKGGRVEGYDFADSCATRLGLHPSNIWDDWWDA